MGIGTLIISKSGGGKSSSMRTINKEHWGIINCAGKPLPFKNDLPMYVTNDIRKAMGVIKNAAADSIVVDDAGYMMTDFYIKNADGMDTGSGKKDKYAVYTALASDYYNFVNMIQSLPPRKLVYVMMHESEDDFGNVKPRTIGKMLDNVICLEGLFSIVLRAVYKNGRYLFSTKTDGKTIVKTPMGMFDEEFIDNDLAMVDKTIREFYNIQGDENGSV
jgi:hypothetical protein